MKDILMSSGDPIDALAGKTVSGKRLNAANAVEMANPVWGYNMKSAENTTQVVAGDTTSLTIETSARNSWATGTVAFITSGDLAATVNPTSISVGQSATMSIPTAAETPFGWSHVMVEGETEGQLDEEGNPIKDRSIAYTVDVLPFGMQEFTFAINESIALPDGNPTGIESVISLGDEITTIDTKVWVNIPSGDASDFKIKLTSPSGTTKTVYNRQSSAGEGLVAEIDLGRAFYGEMVAGDWTLQVADEVRLDRATFAGWSITFDGVGELLPAAPVTDFSYDASGLTVAFTSLSTDNNNDIVSYAWDFGDETTSTEQNPTHTFESDSGYDVSLTTTDSRGESTTRTKTVWAAEKSLDLTIPRQYLSRSGTLRNKLVWAGSEAETVSIFRNGVEIATDVANTGKYTDSERRVTETSFDYQVCDSNDICSPEVLVEF
jgi:PKD repeat protein